MANNQDQTSLGKVSDHASIRMERARPLQPMTGSSSFDVEASTSKVHASPTSSSLRRQSPPVTSNTSLTWSEFMSTN